MAPWLHTVVGVTIFGAALIVLYRGLRDVRPGEVMEALAALPRWGLAWALLLTAASYLVQTGYDHLAFRYLGRRIGAWRVTAASFIGFAVSNNVGAAVVSGASVRYRFYARWGIGASDLGRLILFYFITCWLGIVALGGWSLLFHPHPALADIADGGARQAAGAALLAATAAYLALPLLGGGSLRLPGFEVALPRPHVALLQLMLSLLDWLLAAAVLYVLLPDGGPAFGVLLGGFVAAQLLGMLSHVPGGVGVFEGVMLLTLGAFFAPPQIVALLLLYRLVYYLLPLVVALLMLLVDEVHRRRLRYAAT